MIMDCILWVTANLKLAVFMKMHVSFCLPKVWSMFSVCPSLMQRIRKEKINSKGHTRDQFSEEENNWW